MKRALAVLFLVLLIGAGIVAYSSSESNVPTTTSSRSAPTTSKAPASGSPIAMQTPPPSAAPHGDKQPVPEADQAYRNLGRLLDGHAIRCFAGDEYNGIRLHSDVGAGVVSGWYHDVVHPPKGTKRIEEPLTDSLVPELEPLFEVRWSTADGSTSPTCTVHPYSFATVEVSVTDEEGDPQNRTVVEACGTKMTTLEGGKAELQIPFIDASTTCKVTASNYLTQEEGFATLTGLRSHGVQTLAVVVDTPIANPGMPTPEDFAEREMDAEEGLEEKRARYQALLDLKESSTGEATAIYEQVGERWKTSLDDLEFQVDYNNALGELMNWDHSNGPPPQELRDRVQAMSDQMAKRLGHKVTEDGAIIIKMPGL